MMLFWARKISWPYHDCLEAIRDSCSTAVRLQMSYILEALLVRQKEKRFSGILLPKANKWEQSSKGGGRGQNSQEPWPGGKQDRTTGRAGVVGAWVAWL